jgi:hypothetical protein
VPPLAAASARPRGLARALLRARGMIAALVVLVLAAPVPPRPPAASPDPLEAAYAALTRITEGEPAIGEVQSAAARRAAGAVPVAAGGVRSRAAALLPRLTAEYRNDQRSYRVAGLQGSGEVDYVRSSPGQVFLVRATWELSALLLPPGPAPSAAGATERARRSEEAARRATELFYERRRLQLTLLVDAPPTPLGQAELEVELARLTAELDLLTGGLFARAR